MSNPVEPPCSHCGLVSFSGWKQDELLQMMADGAYPPSACGFCWNSVAVAHLDIMCETPDACPHIVRHP